MMRPVHWLLAGTAMLALGGCATRPSDPAAAAAYDETNDPLEPMNRKIFGFNLTADDYVLKPVAKGYRYVVPEYGRQRIRNVLDNAHEPVVAANSLLQGRIEDGLKSFWRFAFNSTVGLVGLYDVASGIGLPEKPADFGQTLYTWGLPDGPYLMLPILGPSNPRDAVGLGVDSYADPLGHFAGNNGYEAVNYARAGVDGVDLRERNIETLDDLRRNSLDFYAQLRSVFRQHRKAQLEGGQGGTNPFPTDDSLYTDPAATPAAPTPTAPK